MSGARKAIRTRPRLPLRRRKMAGFLAHQRPNGPGQKRLGENAPRVIKLPSLLAAKPVRDMDDQRIEIRPLWPR